MCLAMMEEDSFHALGEHLVQEEQRSDGKHIMWLNRYIGIKKAGLDQVREKLEKLYSLDAGLKEWIIRRLVERIYGEPLHPFIVRMQHPDNKTIYGYVMEHHHFLGQWIRSCSAIISKTRVEEVQLFEIDNIVSEYRGIPPDTPSHHELLLRMGESIGVPRSTVYDTAPLPATIDSLNWWDRISKECDWVETMAAMHTLELTANPDIKKMGAKSTYFDSAVLNDPSYSAEVKQFLGEGYKADSGHSMVALDLVEKYCDPGKRRNVQSTVLKSVELLDNYLMARVERGESYGN